MTDIATLCRDMLAYADKNGFSDQPSLCNVAGLTLVRVRQPAEFSAIRYEPMFCLVLQGAKQACLGNALVTFAERDSLICSIDLPTAGRVVTASPQAPYLALAIPIDTGLLRELSAELETTGASPQDRPRPDPHSSALAVGPVDDALLDAMARLFALREDPAGARSLAPLIIREIHFRLLRAENGGLLRRLMQTDSHAERIARAIHRIRRDFASALSIDALAREAGMSASSFHAHFRALTGTTPHRYQKAMRLMEARRLLAEGSDSISAIAFAVGYESPTQFSREYRSKFNRSPREDRRLAG
ncbi:AraC family transcriptional regulator [Maricaulis sp. W15]|uniref:AraC family transcriptional regulator n=1 Tax=Maricaulis sp. W15 TaxID=1772333 RepID=UPI000A6995F1|nr:AraC family transcriptional regulator [Maricaulis sp. W15]